MKLLLFDLDGTILLTGGAGVRGMEQAGAICFGNHFSLKNVKVAGGLDPLIYTEACALAGVENAHLHHDSFRTTYLRELETNLAAAPDKVVLLPGIASLLHELREHNGVTLGMVTGNYATAVPIKLRAIGVDLGWFAITACGDEAPDRPAMVRLAMDRYREYTGRDISPHDTIVIGDTPNDIRCAHANGCTCFAVATGLYSVDDLRRAGANVVVPNLADPQPLYALL